MAASLMTIASSGFQAPASVVAPSTARASLRMATLDQLPGTGPELNQGKPWDPLGISDMCPYGSMQYEWLRTAEIKHGRVCMAASVGWLVQEAGIHFPGNLASTPPTSFESLSSLGAFEAWAAVPDAGKAQILIAAGILEAANEAKKPHYLNAGMPSMKASSPKKERGLLSELKNGRLAMIAVASFVAEVKIDGAVPLLPASWH